MAGRMVRLENFQSFQAINVLSDPGAVGGPRIVPNCVEFIIQWQLTNGKIANQVLGMIVGASYNPTVANAEAGRASLVSGANWTTLAAFIIPTARISAVLLRDIRQPNLPLISSTGAATPGTSTGTALPDEVAFCITLRTNQTGPGNRGRSYIPGWATNAIGAGGIVAAGAVTAAAQWASNSWGPAMVAAGGTNIGLIQPARNAYIGSTGTSHPARNAQIIPITGIVARDNHWDSQRRRGLK
jgi:hypothetical protein